VFVRGMCSAVSADDTLFLHVCASMLWTPRRFLP
jgi:hypothetical protein